MKKKIISGVIATALLCQIAPMSIFADEIKDLEKKQNIEHVKNNDVDKIESNNNQNNTEEKDKSIEKNSDKNVKNSTIIDIPDENFKAVLNKQLGQPENSDITKIQMESITEINANKKDISSIEGIQYCKNLTKLKLQNNNIADLGNLENLQNLTEVDLSHNEIESLVSLKNLKKLTKVIATNQNIIKMGTSDGKYFSVRPILFSIDDREITPSNIENGGKFENGRVKWDNVDELADDIHMRFVDLNYTFNENYTTGKGTVILFSGTVNNKVMYNRGEDGDYKIGPVIVGADDIVIKKGSKFNPMDNVKAFDYSDNKPINITNELVLANGEVNINKEGVYLLTYEVTNNGYTTSKERKVTVTGEDFLIEEIVGSDRYNTANKISDKWTRADNVVISNSNLAVDAMTASPFAHAKNAPILLSNKSSLTPETKTSIARLQAQTVYLIGGEDSLDKNLEKEIKNMGVNVVRIGGKDRFETSLKIAKEVDNLSDVSQIAIVNGQKGLADAISISSPAAMNNMPIILSNNEGNIPQGKDFIKTEDLSKAYVIGGHNLISDNLKNEVSDIIKNKPVDRLGGKDRIETNMHVLNEFYGSGSLNNLFVVKDGTKREVDLLDSLSVSSLAAREKSPIMIVADKKDLEQVITSEQINFIKNKTFAKLTRVGGNGNENAFKKIVNLYKTLN